MGFTSPEEELQQFLAQLPSWMHKAIQGDFPSTAEEARAFAEYGLERFLDTQREYERLARRIPSEWRAYCAKRKSSTLEALNLPTPGIGRPRKSALADEARMLRVEGKSYNDIALELNAKYGPGTTNREAIRKLLGKRKVQTTPDKTQS